MPGTARSLSTKRGGGASTVVSVAPPPTSNEFHQVRIQEFQRERALKEQGASNSQIATSYFVPTLQSTGADILAQNFASMPEIDNMRLEQLALYDMVIERLPTKESELPLSVSVPRIASESYWKRCCESRWSQGQISKFAGERLISKEYGWKQLYLEHVLSDFLMALRGRPVGNTADGANNRDIVELMRHHRDEDDTMMLGEEDARALAELCAICKDYVRSVDLVCQYTHLNLQEHLFSKCPGIIHFRLTYGASNAGIGYDRRMIGFTETDAQFVRFLVQRNTVLEELELPNNHLNSNHVVAICAGLVCNSTIRVLDLSGNAVDDAAVKAISLLLCRDDFPLEELYLRDNDIRHGGAQALADSLDLNKSLRVLNVSQNRIPDEHGGELLIRALVKHPQLSELHLGYNCLGPECVQALSEVLPQVENLKVLTLSGNRRIGGDRLELSDSDPGLGAGSGTATSNPMTNSVDGAGGSQPNTPGDVAQSPVTASSPSAEPAEQEANVATEPAKPTRPNTAPASSVNGPLLCTAVQSNNSLEFIDVRFCKLTEAEVAMIEETVRSRVQANRSAEVNHREEQLREKRAEDTALKITKTRGRTLN